MRADQHTDRYHHTPHRITAHFEAVSSFILYPDILAVYYEICAWVGLALYLALASAGHEKTCLFYFTLQNQTIQKAAVAAGLAANNMQIKTGKNILN